MAWVIDTCILLDVGLDDPTFATRSESLLKAKLDDGLMICPVTFVELAPAFSGQIEALENFLFQLGIDHQEDWMMTDTLQASAAWAEYVRKRRLHQTSKRPIADILIGAFALRHQGLLTRNSGDFQKLFPTLRIVEP